MNKKYALIILGGMGIGLAIFYLYMYYPSSYNEGIGVMISEDPEMVTSFNNKYSVYLLQEEEFEKIPKIKYMMDVLLTRDKTIGEKRIVHHGPDNVRYEIRANLNEYSIKVGMSTSELGEYNKWVESKSTYLFEYEEVVFLIFNWDVVNENEN